MATIKETIVKENFLFPSFFNRLNNLIESQQLDWRFEGETVVGAKDNNIFFSLTLFNKITNTLNTPYKQVFEPILYFVNQEVDFKDCIRMQMNLYVNHTVQCLQKKHIDVFDSNSKDKAPLKGLVTAVFNFTDCDGFTQIEDKKYPSKANSIIIFDGTKFHCGATPTNAKKRVVLNINVI